MRREENYIISENPELSIGDAPGWLGRLRGAFPAFEERNFRLYFSGQFISQIGTWLQTVAQGWLVLELTHSAFWVGTVAALAGAPILLFGLGGGVIADRFPKRRILLITQTIAMLLAFLLGALAMLHLASVLTICILAFLLGMVDAVDKPARQAFVPEIMARKNLTSAIALTAATFNASRVIGPALAGLLIALIGSGGTFMLNGASFLAAIAAIFAIRVGDREAPVHPHPLTAIRDGLRYTFRQASLRLFLIASSTVALFGFSYGAILPALTEAVFHRGADGLGYLYAAQGIGSVLAAVFISALSRRLGSHIFIIGGNFLLAFSLGLFAVATAFPLGLVAAFGIGLAITAEFSTINSAIQHRIEDAWRGRVASIYMFMFMGAMPLGSIAMGYGAERFGFPTTLLLGALGVFFTGIVLFWNREKLREHRR